MFLFLYFFLRKKERLGSWVGMEVKEDLGDLGKGEII